MRKLTDKELLMVSGADSGLTVSPETIGGAIGGTIGSYFGPVGGGVGIVVGGAVANSIANGTREPGSVTGGSGIPWGASMGGPYKGS
jgi:hypothetical protein